MKKIAIVGLAFVMFSAFTILTGINDIISGIKAGNASSVSKYFDNTVEISLAGKSNNYSKSQGEAVLRDFFANNTVKSFSVVHQGDAGGSQFLIGTLITTKGDKQMLQEIKFDH
jgi:hypothetical protein